MAYRLLARFEDIFRDGPYRHRRSNLGDSIAIEWYEDMYALGSSSPFSKGVAAKTLVVNTRNWIPGKRARRGDGTLGDLVPSVTPNQINGYDVLRGPTATLRIGIEVKIPATAMLRQVDRVISDLNKQARVFEELSRKAPTGAIVGLNWANDYLSFEGDRTTVARKAPSREAGEVRRRIQEQVRDYDELLFLEFKATNREPYNFAWINSAATRELYAAALLGVSNQFTDAATGGRQISDWQLGPHGCVASR